MSLKVAIPATLLLGVFASSASWAQEEPPPPAALSTQEAATSGATDVAQEGFQQAAAPPPSSERLTELAVTAGGNLTTGNSENLNLTAGLNYLLRRKRSQLTAAAAVNYSQAPTTDEDGNRTEDSEATAENYQGRVKYDYFALDDASVFVSFSARRDRFQGLLWRLNIDPGFSYYFLDEEKHRFWGELGYDLQHDIRTDGALLFAKEDGTEGALKKTETRHYSRLYAGYTNRLNAAVTLNTGLEYLQGLVPFEDEELNAVNMRLNWDATLTSSLTEAFSIAASVGVRYDNNPLPGIQSTDTVTAIQLVYSML